MDEVELLRAAVHALDKRLTETDAWARSGIDHNAGNLQRMVDSLKETRDNLYNSSNGKPGLLSIVNTWYYETIPALKARQDLLDKRQAWMMRILLSGLVSLALGLVLALVTGKR